MHRGKKALLWGLLLLTLHILSIKNPENNNPAVPTKVLFNAERGGKPNRNHEKKKQFA